MINCKKITEKQLWGAIIIFHLLAVVFGLGFLHFDEHFQIIEFLNYKLGGIEAHFLPWEFQERIRPWFQPFILYCFALPLKSIGISSPFVLSGIFRLISSALGIASIYYFWRQFKDELTENRLSLLFWLGLLWFIPYLHARPSSESWSASFFLLGLSCFMGKRSNWGGVFFAFSFLCRYQMGFMIAPVYFWAVFRRWPWRAVIMSFIVLWSMIALGSLCDYWGYGEWSLAPWNYLKVNLIENKAAHFGVDPFYYYITRGFSRGYPPISLLIIVSSVYFWWKNPKHILTWVGLPFLVVHSLIGHKELRFILPFLVLTPYFIVYAFSHCSLLKANWIRRLCFGVNIILLIVASLKMANPAVGLYRFLAGTSIETLYVGGEDPYKMVGLPLRFYQKRAPKIVEHQKLTEIPFDQGKYIMTRHGPDLFPFLENPSCQLLYLTYPRFLLNFNIGNWIARSRVWGVFYCQHK